MDTPSIVAICSVVILALFQLCWFFIQRELKKPDVEEDREYQEKIREKDLLDKRLGAGAGTMESIKAAIEDLRMAKLAQAGSTVSCIQFDEYKKDHDADHAKIEQTFLQIKSTQVDIRECLVSLDSKVDGMTQTMAKALAKLVEVANPEQVGDE